MRGAGADSDLEMLGPTQPQELPLYIRPTVLGPMLTAARGDPEATRKSIREALRGELAPEVFMDVMRLQPQLRPFLDPP